MRGAAIVIAGVVLAGCQSGLADAQDLPSVDEAYFRCNVQPIVTKSCSMFLCHGDTARYYTVFARNRLRFGVDERNAEMIEPEWRFAYDATRAHIDRDDPDDSLLLKKPLDESAGGYFHGGATEFGQGDVYLSTDEEDYRTLLAWVNGATASADCSVAGGAP